VSAICRKHRTGGPHHVQGVVRRLPGEGLKAFGLRLPAGSFHAGEIQTGGPVWRDNPQDRRFRGPRADRRLAHPADLAGTLVFRGDGRVRVGRDPLQHQQPDPPLTARPACRGGPVAVRERGAAVLVCAAHPYEPEAELTCPEVPKKTAAGSKEWL